MGQANKAIEARRPLRHRRARAGKSRDLLASGLHSSKECQQSSCEQDELTAALFAERYSLRRPVIVRNTSLNLGARQFLADRCKIMRDYGDVAVDVGDPFSLTVHGRPSSSMSLREHLGTPFSAKMPLYFFDRSGKCLQQLGPLASLLEPPPSVRLEPPGPEQPVIFAIGKTGSGIGLHAHQDAWNQVLFGAKRWALYPGSPGGVPPEAGYNPTEPHLTWMKKVYPKVKDDPELQPLECVQREGDVLYVPEGWYHATVNLGDTAAISGQSLLFVPGSPREVVERAGKALMYSRVQEAVALGEEAHRMDPREGDHLLNLAHAYEAAGRDVEARAAVERAVELLPRNPGAYFTLGQQLNEKREWPLAEKALRRAARLVSKASLDNLLVRGIRAELAKVEKGIQASREGPNPEAGGRGGRHATRAAPEAEPLRTAEQGEAAAPRELPPLAELQALKARELKALCGERGLRTTGKKHELVERLQASRQAKKNKPPSPLEKFMGSGGGEL